MRYSGINFIRLGLVVLNTGSTSTFSGGYTEVQRTRWQASSLLVDGRNYGAPKEVPKLQARGSTSQEERPQCGPEKSRISGGEESPRSGHKSQ